jgi:hypothetical protein
MNGGDRPMARQKFFAALAAACALAAPALCAQTQTQSRPARAEVFAASSVAGSQYTNRALGLTFKIPNEMRVESAAAAKKTEGAGHRAPEASGHGTDPASDPAHPQAQEQTIHLVSLADLPSSAAPSPAQILVLAYDLGDEKFSNQEIVAGIVSGMSSEPGDWQAGDTPHEQTYGGKKFWQQGLKGTIPFGGRTISVYVEILATQCRGYAVAWTLTAATEERLAALTKIFPTIQFSPECPAL